MGETRKTNASIGESRTGAAQAGAPLTRQACPEGGGVTMWTTLSQSEELIDLLEQSQEDAASLATIRTEMDLRRSDMETIRAVLERKKFGSHEKCELYTLFHD